MQANSATLPLSIIPCMAVAVQLCNLPAPPPLQILADDDLDYIILNRLANQLGFDYIICKDESLPEIMSLPLVGPVVLVLKDQTSLLLVGQVAARQEAMVVRVDEAGKAHRLHIPLAELVSAWAGIALLLQPRRQQRHVHAMISIARHYGRDLAEPHLIHQYLLWQGEPDAKLFMRMLSDYGFEGRTAEVGLDSLAQMPAALPVLLHCKNGALLILWGLANKDGKFTVENPDQPQAGRQQISREEVEKHFDGRITFVKQTEVLTSIEKPRKKFGMGFFIDEISQMGKNFVEVGLAAVMMQIIALATPLFFQIIIDRVVTHQTESTLHVLSLGMLAAILFEGGFFWLRSYLLLYTTSVIDLRLAIRTFEHLSKVSLPFFERVPAGVLIKHMQQPEKIREFLTGRLFGTLLDSISLIVVLPVLFAYSWRLTVLVLAFSGLSALVIYLAMGPFRQRLQDLYATEGERQAFLVENIHAMPTVKSLSLEPLRRRGWDNRAAVATGMRFRVGKMSISISVFMKIIQQCMTLGILWWGVYQVFGNVMTVGALVAFNMYSARVSGPLVSLAGLIQQYEEMSISMEMLAQVMDEPVESGDERWVLPRIEGAVTFKDVTFRYNPDSAPALSGVSFSYPAGSVIGIVGRSGSGKSTLTRLLLRIQHLREGDIWIDKYNIHDIDIAHLRRSIGVVLQDNFIFRARVRDNIAVSKPSASLEEIMRVSRLAAAHGFIENLPDGYNTLLEEGGSNLSGGQRQRIAIARALLTNPRLMIFDEATSALDPESEAEIQANIDHIARGRTMIIVSHRLSLLSHADAILVLDKGHLVGQGTHAELYRDCEIYRTLWDTQNGISRHGAEAGGGAA